MMRIHLLILICFFSVSAWAQIPEDFGVNRIQYKQFSWQYISSENFDVYYYGNYQPMAQRAADYLEVEFEKLTGLIGASPVYKTKIFLYQSIHDLQQSNVNLYEKPYTAGGETKFVKPYIEVANPGSIEDFKNELTLRVSELLVNEMMFGGSLRDMFQNAVFLDLPDWFVNGAAYYLANGWSEEMDNFVRQIVKSNRTKKAFQLTGHEGALVGQSFWNFIVERYGAPSINGILNYTRIIRNEQKGIQLTLGVPYKMLLEQWKEFYTSEADAMATYYVSPNDSLQLVSAPHTGARITTVKISPDGQYLAYALNEMGTYTIYLQTLATGKTKKVLDGGIRVIKQRWDEHVPLIAWIDATTLGSIVFQQGKFILHQYNINTRNTSKRVLQNFQNIRSISFSSNGRLAAVSGDMNGQNDLFLLSLRRDLVRRLTNDLYDDVQPTFLPSQNRIIFSSNRSTDSLSSSNTFLQLPQNFNLYAFDLDSGRVLSQPLTRTVSRDFQPVPIDDNRVLYLSDQRGVDNLFAKQLYTNIYTQLTRFSSGIKSFDFHGESNQLAFVMTNKLKDQLYVMPIRTDEQIFTPPTKRKEAEQIKSLALRRKSTIKPGMTVKEMVEAQLQKKEQRDSATVKKDTTQTKKGIDTNDYSFDEPAPAVSQEEPKKQPVINTDQYQFEDDVPEKQKTSDSFLARYAKAKSIQNRKGPFPYQPQTVYDKFKNVMGIDPFRGLMYKFEMQVNDILENVRLHGGLHFRITDLKSGDAFVQFDYLPRHTDYSIRFERKVYFWTPPNTDVTEQVEEKYVWQKIEAGVSYPLSLRTRVSFKPFIGLAQYIDRGLKNPTSTPAFRQSLTQFYYGPKVEIVYDNSVQTGLNITQGTKGKISYTVYGAAGNDKKSFSKLSIDIRHYQKLYKQITLAFRGFAGGFFGQSVKNFMLGGVSSTAFPNINYDGTANPLTNTTGYNEQFLFADFSTTLRGFAYSTLYGSRILSFNGELRIPVFRTMASGPISSNFFKNFQLIGFYDIGTAWTGKPPFGSSGSSVRTRLVPVNDKTNPFQIEIDEFSNPWIYSYGGGVRTVILGHFIWMNMAWPVQNYKVGTPQFDLGIGLDF